MKKLRNYLHYFSFKGAMDRKLYTKIFLGYLFINTTLNVAIGMGWFGSLGNLRFFGPVVFLISLVLMWVLFVSVLKRMRGTRLSEFRQNLYIGGYTLITFLPFLLSPTSFITALLYLVKLILSIIPAFLKDKVIHQE